MKQVAFLLPMLVLTVSCTDEYGNLTEFGIMMIIFGVIFVVGIIIAMVAESNRKARQEKAVQDALSDRTDFSESRVIKGDDPIFYLASDDTQNKVFYVFEGEKLLFDYKDVASVDTIADGEITVSKKSVAGTIGGAVLGGVLAGGAGAIIGGTSSKSTSHQQVSTLKVHVLLRNQEKQSFDIICFDGGANMTKSTYQMVFPSAATKAQEVFDFFKLIIDKVDSESLAKRIAATPERQEKTSIEELKELSELLKQGIITDEEFATLKAKIITKD